VPAPQLAAAAAAASVAAAVGGDEGIHLALPVDGSASATVGGALTCIDLEMVTVGAALLGTDLPAGHCIQAEAVEPVKDAVAAHSQGPDQAGQKPVAPVVAASEESSSAAAAVAPFAVAAPAVQTAASQLARIALVVVWEVGQVAATEVAWEA